MGETPRDQLCTMPAVSGHCRANVTRWHYNNSTNRCEKFFYGGCRGNENRFTTEDECQTACACTLPPDAGQGEALIPSWYYNDRTGRCEEFIYSGCDGNSNNFLNAEKCSAT